MKNFQRALAELSDFCRKNDIPNGLKISIVLRNEQDKAYFIRGLKDELQPPNFETRIADFSEIKLHGMEVRILS